MKTLSMYDVQCDACKEWKHYKDEFAWSGNKRSSKCNACRGQSPEPQDSLSLGTRR